MKVLISGGGTGGHIYPAIAIADALKQIDNTIEILFVGANGRMEMSKVPKAGYDIRGLNISGLQRRLTLKNLSFPFKVMKSLRDAGRIISEFKPDVGVGVGGYASGPSMYKLASRGLPLLLQEQNSYPGITNKILAKKASSICTAYPGMETFFDQAKIHFTGNPVRKDLLEIEGKRTEALEYFGLLENKKTCLLVGGSLGARTLNVAMSSATTLINQHPDIQFIWQMGGAYEEQFMQCETALLQNVKAMAFIERMDLAYAAADVLIARAGALTISELSIVGVPSILVPSPHVAEDHQTKNAMALVNKEAAILVKDNEASGQLISRLLKLVDNQDQLDSLSSNVKRFAKPDAASTIANLVIDLVNN